MSILTCRILCPRVFVVVQRSRSNCIQVLSLSLEYDFEMLQFSAPLFICKMELSGLSMGGEENPMWERVGRLELTVANDDTLPTECYS